MTSKAVTESEKGTTPTEEEQANAASTAEGETPDEASKVSPAVEKVEEKPLYTQSQTDVLIHAATSEAGRLKKDAETERDTAKSEVTKLTSELEGTTEDIKQLETKLDDMASEDPKRFDVVKELKEARELKGKLKTATAELATSAKDNEAVVTTAKETMLEIALWEIASEFKGGDPVRLKALCATTGITTEEKARDLAAGIWDKTEAKAAPAKKGEGEVKEKLSLDSGKSTGGGEPTEEERLNKRYPKTATK